MVGDERRGPGEVGAGRWDLESKEGSGLPEGLGEEGWGLGQD